MTQTAPSTWIITDTREVNLNENSTNFLKVWISMMFYKSSSWLWRVYWEFVDDSWKFSREKYEKYLDWIIKSIKDREINIPNANDINVEEILKTDIEDFYTQTQIPGSISERYSGVVSVNQDEVRRWIKAYYEEKLKELKSRGNQIEPTKDATKNLIKSILDWLKII